MSRFGFNTINIKYQNIPLVVIAVVALASPLSVMLTDRIIQIITLC